MARCWPDFPVEVPGQTVNRLCGSGLQAVNAAAQAIWSGQGDVFVAGGVESMTRAPLVMLKPDAAYPRGVPAMADSTLGWRFPHPSWRQTGTPRSLGQTAENVAERRGVSREDQDAFALLSQQKAGRAIEQRPAGRGDRAGAGPAGARASRSPSSATSTRAPTPRLRRWRKLRPAFAQATARSPPATRPGINDGAAALLVTSAERARSFGLQPLARVVSTAVAGVKPDEMGLGPIPASRKALAAGRPGDRGR